LFYFVGAGPDTGTFPLDESPGFWLNEGVFAAQDWRRTAENTGTAIHKIARS
jgi:hypothetical protein